MTRAEAIAALVEQDVARWGEQEREASERLRSRRTLGLALNELANRAELADSPNLDLRCLAKDALTAEDWRVLRNGG